jgi:DNA topoisomerase II
MKAPLSAIRMSEPAEDEQIVHLTDVEHARQRPGMYVGSVTVDEQTGWFAEEIADGVAYVMRFTSVRVIPALCKIIDEIMCNAADRTMYDCTRIDFEFTQLENDLYQFRIRNNGSGIPVVPIDDRPGSPLGPTACFGLTRTGTNFGDHSKTGSGTNGMGSKLTNIFSSLFTAVTCDAKRGLRWEQTWADSLSEETSDPEPTVTPLREPSHTQITVIPDYEYFQRHSPDTDLPEVLQGCLRYIMRRAFEIAAFCSDRRTTVRIHHRYIETPEEVAERLQKDPGTSGEPQAVTISDSIAGYRTFLQYVEALVSGQASSSGHQLGHYNIEELSNSHRWRVYMVYPNVDGVAAKAPPIPGMAMVNAISCLQGKHVDHVKAVLDRSMRNVGFLGDNRSITTNFRKNATLFIACRVENIAFNSQTKELLTTPEKKWINPDCVAAGQRGSFEFSDAQARALLAGGLEETIQTLMGARPVKASGKRPNIPKLEDANNAGRPGCYCTLIITEGDSAKTLVMSGRKELRGGSDDWGVYPIRGKMINSRKKASDSQQAMQKKAREQDRKEAKEREAKSTLESLMSVIGLRRRMVYPDTSGLRYQRLVFMTDQDTDGDHIKGLLINLIEYHWPSLAAIPGFICSIETPLLKAFPLKKTSKPVEFTSVAEYEDWLRAQGLSESKVSKRYRIKYYKGLGSSTGHDGREYFRTLNDYLTHEGTPSPATNRNFVRYQFDEDSHQSLELVFGTDTEKRKQWILQPEPIEYRFRPEQTVTQFLGERVKKYSEASNRRAIANLMDGFKPVQRKVLYTAVHDRLVVSQKVVAFAGRVMNVTKYHHGETSLYGTIVGLARNYVGSNNINLLYPDGGFGSRANHKSAAPRYIDTRLSRITRRIFPQDTDDILEYEIDDGERVEPKWFMPVIPMVLVNGCQGTGTGWRTFIPPHNPMDLVDRIRAMIETEGSDPYSSRKDETRRHDVTLVIKGREASEAGEDKDNVPMIPGFPRLVPYYKGFRGTIRMASAFKYEVFGCLDDKPRCVDVRGASDRQWRVTEFDPAMTIEQYSKFISEVTDQEGRPIFADIHKYNGDNTIEFIMFPRKDFQMPEDPMERLQLFGLVSSLDVSNMYLFVPDRVASGGVGFRKYDTTEDILIDFYLLRLEAYERQRLHQIEELRRRIRHLGAKVKFVLAAIKGTSREAAERDSADAIVIAGRRRADVRTDSLRVVGLEYDDLIDGFLDMSLSSLTHERVEAIRKELGQLQMELEDLEGINGAALWLDDLDALESALAEPEEI